MGTLNKTPYLNLFKGIKAMNIMQFECNVTKNLGVRKCKRQTGGGHFGVGILVIVHHTKFIFEVGREFDVSNPYMESGTTGANRQAVTILFIAHRTKSGYVLIWARV